MFRLALTHRSATLNASDNKSQELGNNERLEYLGDAIIEMIVSLILHERFPTYNEGTLSQMRSNIVCRASLNDVASQMGIVEHIERHTKIDLNKSHITGDAIEALVAAIYLDGGFKRAMRFVRKNIANDKRIVNSMRGTVDGNYKSNLLMLFDGSPVEITFDTHRMGESSIDEDGNTINFISKVLKDGIIIGTGFGQTKKTAEQKASQKALAQITTEEEQKNKTESEAKP